MTAPARDLAEGLARPVREVMHQAIVACRPDTPLRQVARMMGVHRVHCVVVYRDDPDGGLRPWGVISDLDVLSAALVGGDEETAADAAATPLVTVRPEEEVDRAARLMVEHATSHVVVVGGNGLPVGILSTLDMARAIGHREIRLARAGARSDGPA